MGTSHAEVIARVVDVQCTDEELQVVLEDGRRLAAPLTWFPRLLAASPVERASWRLIGSGEGIHWDALDEDISLQSLLRGERAYR